MARLSLANTLQAVRPFFRRSSTRDSGLSSSTLSSRETDNTTQTSTQPSPTLPSSKLRIEESCHESDTAAASGAGGADELPRVPGESAASVSELPPIAAASADEVVSQQPVEVVVKLPQPPPPIASADGPHHVQRSDSAERLQDQELSAPSRAEPGRPRPAHISILPSSHGPGHALSQGDVASSDVDIVNTVVEAPEHSYHSAPVTSAVPQSFSSSVPNMAQLLMRKIWVKRPNASATLVQIREDDLVDDVRDMILKKYANSLGRTFDSPDMTLRIVSRVDGPAMQEERTLGPEEEICRTIDSHFPGGQKVEDALIIDVPQKRTPRPSPKPHHHHSYHHMDDYRPLENGTDYFPPMPVIAPANMTLGPIPGREHHHSIPNGEHAPRSISVLNTGQIAALPSPGGQARRHRDREHRPKIGRQHTSSPVIITHAPNGGAANPATVSSLAQQQVSHRQSLRPRLDSSASEAPRPTLANNAPVPPPLPSPPAPVASPTNQNGSSPPTPSSNANAVQRPPRPKRARKSTPDKVTRPQRISPPDGLGANHIMPNISSMLDNSVPPINVLIVEDNGINLKIMESLMKRLKVRWQTAMNGQIAVDKWRKGGYHLVLMDIQMPIMNGLQATKEIRRLERVNGIGVFSSSAPGSPVETSKTSRTSDIDHVDKGKQRAKDPADDALNTAEGLFKSPVIIVALTASSLQSDRHEALAAGCNDFLTKPVSFIWLERKVKEWGCMQALIDFDGWRKWRDYATKEEAGKSEAQKEKDREAEEKQKKKMEKMAILQERARVRAEEEKKEKERKLAAAKLDDEAEGAGAATADDEAASEE